MPRDRRTNVFTGFTPTREIWPNTGNEHIPDQPRRLPNAGQRGFGGLVSPYPGQVIRTNEVQRIISPDDYQQWQTDSRAMLAGTNLEILGEPQNSRIYLAVRIAASSIGSLAVGLNVIPASVDLANFLIGPGATLIFETKVPQNRLFGVAVGGNLRYVITYANLTVGL